MILALPLEKVNKIVEFEIVFLLLFTIFVQHATNVLRKFVQHSWGLGRSAESYHFMDYSLIRTLTFVQKCHSFILFQHTAQPNHRRFVYFALFAAASCGRPAPLHFFVSPMAFFAVFPAGLCSAGAESAPPAPQTAKPLVPFRQNAPPLAQASPSGPKKRRISCRAASGESEPWMRFRVVEAA